MSKRLLPYIFCFFIHGLSLPGFAQEYSYVDYTVRDGLAGSTVYGMVKDRDGFIWFGTETGLSRFDGTHFRNFYMSDGLPDNEIIKLFVDSRNRVWIIPFKNSICYYRNGKIHNQENDPLLQNLTIRSEVVSVTEDASGEIVVAESRAIHLLSPDGAVTNIDRYEGKPMMVVQTGLNTKGKIRFIVGINGDDLFVDLENGELVGAGGIPCHGPNNYTSTYISPRLEMYEDEDSLRFIDPQDNTGFNLRLPKGFINMSKLNDSCITLNAYSATLMVDVRHKRIIDSFLPGQTVNGVLEDPEGGLWFCTLGGGIYRLATRAAVNYSFRDHNTVFPVFSIQKADSTLYIGTDRFRLWSSTNNGKSFYSRQVYDRFSRGRITAILRSRGKKIIVGTDAGVFSVEERGRRSRLLWQRGSVKALSVLSDSTVLDFSGISARIMRLSDGKALDTLWNSRSTCGCLQKDRCYIGTLTGLYVLALPNRGATPEERYQLLPGRVSAMEAAPDGAVWVATYGEGLAVYVNNRIKKRLTADNGLTSNICRCLFIDHGNVWVGTDKGLNKISPAGSGEKISQFTTADGLSSDIINTIFVDGKNVYAGTPEGMTLFNEDRVVTKRECRLRMTGISIAGREWPLDTTNFTLPYKENDLQFDFVGIAYRGAGSIRYRYRLLGTDEKWRTTGQTFLHYPSLPPGHYELQILADGGVGSGSGSMLRLPFTIDKPFWERNWVRVLLALAAGGLIWLAFHYRVKTIKRKEAEKTATAAKIAELEQMALRSRMNPHFIFNSLNSIQLFVMEKDILGANEYITQFSRLIRQTLDISARASIRLEEELDYLSTYLELEKRRFENAFDYSIFVAGGIDKREYSRSEEHTSELQSLV